MKTIEEVKEHFKDAKKVKCMADDSVHNASEVKLEEGGAAHETFMYMGEGTKEFNKYAVIYDPENGKLAEIIE